MRLIQTRPDAAIAIDRPDLRPEGHHVFGEDEIQAINFALAANRPLLVRGEPGTGKSQLARAAAQDLGRAFVSAVVDARTEAQDLRWRVDAVRRLAEAQIQGALPGRAEDAVRSALAIEKFVEPGPLWWAFHWKGAEDRASRAGVAPVAAPKGWREQDGTVLLIDEIDKGDLSVPNGLLESLGHRQFDVPGGGTVSQRGANPLVIVTTNEERALPDPFLRRCLVLHLAWKDDERGFVDQLTRRGEAHFPAMARQTVPSEDGNEPESMLVIAARLVWGDRQQVKGQGLAAPGGAEYLDLLRALHERHPDDPAEQAKWLGTIRKFALDKHAKDGR